MRLLGVYCAPEFWLKCRFHGMERQAWLETCLLCKCEDPNSIPRTCIKNRQQRMIVFACITGAGGEEKRILTTHCPLSSYLGFFSGEGLSAFGCSCSFWATWLESTPTDAPHSVQHRLQSPFKRTSQILLHPTPPLSALEWLLTGHQCHPCPYPPSSRTARVSGSSHFFPEGFQGLRRPSWLEPRFSWPERPVLTLHPSPLSLCQLGLTWNLLSLSDPNTLHLSDLS